MMDRKTWYPHYSPLKAAKGGMPQSVVRSVAKTDGLGVRFSPGWYIGHYLVEVDTRNTRKLARLDKLLGWD